MSSLLSLECVCVLCNVYAVYLFASRMKRAFQKTSTNWKCWNLNSTKRHKQLQMIKSNEKSPCSRFASLIIRSRIWLNIVDMIAIKSHIVKPKKTTSLLWVPCAICHNAKIQFINWLPVWWMCARMRWNAFNECVSLAQRDTGTARHLQ